MLDCLSCKVAKRKTQFPKIEGELAVTEVCKKCIQDAKRKGVARATTAVEACRQCKIYKGEVTGLQEKVKELQAALAQQEQLVSRLGRMLSKPQKRGLGRIASAYIAKKKLKGPTPSERKPFANSDISLMKKKRERKHPHMKYVTPSDTDEGDHQDV